MNLSLKLQRSLLHTRENAICPAIKTMFPLDILPLLPLVPNNFRQTLENGSPLHPVIHDAHDRKHHHTHQTHNEERQPVRLEIVNFVFDVDGEVPRHETDGEEKHGRFSQEDSCSGQLFDSLRFFEGYEVEVLLQISHVHGHLVVGRRPWENFG